MPQVEMRLRLLGTGIQIGRSWKSKKGSRRLMPFPPIEDGCWAYEEADEHASFWSMVPSSKGVPACWLLARNTNGCIWKLGLEPVGWSIFFWSQFFFTHAPTFSRKIFFLFPFPFSSNSISFPKSLYFLPLSFYIPLRLWNLKHNVSECNYFNWHLLGFELWKLLRLGCIKQQQQQQQQPYSWQYQTEEACDELVLRSLSEGMCLWN